MSFHTCYTPSPLSTHQQNVRDHGHYCHHNKNSRSPEDGLAALVPQGGRRDGNDEDCRVPSYKDIIQAIIVPKVLVVPASDGFDRILKGIEKACVTLWR